MGEPEADRRTYFHRCFRLQGSSERKRTRTRARKGLQKGVKKLIYLPFGDTVDLAKISGV